MTVMTRMTMNHPGDHHDHYKDRAAQFHSKKPNMLKVEIRQNSWSVGFRIILGDLLISVHGSILPPKNKLMKPINWTSFMFGFHVFLVFNSKCCQFVCCHFCAKTSFHSRFLCFVRHSTYFHDFTPRNNVPTFAECSHFVRSMFDIF